MAPGAAAEVRERHGSKERVAAGLTELAEYVESIDAIAHDHFRLLVGPAEPIAVPWESVYRSQNGLLFGAATVQVRAAYRRFDLEAPKLGVEPDDHISLELGFCRELLVRGLSVSDRGDAAEASHCFEAHEDFCRKHLRRWAPELFERMTNGADTHFYRGIGMLGHDAANVLRAVLR